MTAMMWLPPLIRALATAMLVVTASAIAEALGPFWGALIASLPVSSGPAYLFLAMQHGAAFVAASALSSFAANAATGVFLIVYAVMAVSTSLWRSLAAAVLAWLAAGIATQHVAWTPVVALVPNLVVYGLGIALLPAGRGTEPLAAPPTRRRGVQLLVRAAAVAAFVSLVVGVSTALGAAATGVAAVFPISLISLIVIVQPRIGGPASSPLAANALRSMLGFGLMLLALHLALRAGGTVSAVLAAGLVMLSWSAGLLLLRRRARLRTVPHCQ